VHRLLKSAGTALDKRDHLGMDVVGLATLFRFHEVLQQALLLQVPPSSLSSLDNPSQSIDSSNMELFYSRPIAPALRIAIANRDIKATCILTQSTASAVTSTNTFISCERDLRQRLTSCVWSALALHDENITDFHDLLLQIESTLCNMTCSSSASSSSASSSSAPPFTADAPSECPFQHRDVTNLTVKSFYEEFVKRQQPVFLRGVTQVTFVFVSALFGCLCGLLSLSVCFSFVCRSLINCIAKGWAVWEDWKRDTLLRR